MTVFITFSDDAGIKEFDVDSARRLANLLNTVNGEMRFNTGGKNPLWRDYSKNNVKTHAVINSIFEDYSGILAGGVFKDLLNNKDSKDYDFFFPSIDAFNQAVVFMDSQSDLFTREYSNDNCIGYLTNDAFISLRIELIRKTFGEPEEIINTFDFTVTQCAMFYDGDKYKITINPQLFTDIVDKNLVFAGLNIEHTNLLERLQRYNNYSFKVSNKTFREAITLTCLKNGCDHIPNWSNPKVFHENLDFERFASLVLMISGDMYVTPIDGSSYSVNHAMLNKQLHSVLHDFEPYLVNITEDDYFSQKDAKSLFSSALTNNTYNKTIEHVKTVCNRNSQDIIDRIVNDKGNQEKLRKQYSIILEKKVSENFARLEYNNPIVLRFIELLFNNVNGLTLESRRKIVSLLLSGNLVSKNLGISSRGADFEVMRALLNKAVKENSLESLNDLVDSLYSATSKLSFSNWMDFIEGESFDLTLPLVFIEAMYCSDGSVKNSHKTEDYYGRDRTSFMNLFQGDSDFIMFGAY